VNPLGPYGNVTAAILAIVVILAAVASHIVPGLHSDPWLDNTALLAAGVVFGTQVVQNGTQSAARAALSAASNLDARLSLIEQGIAPKRATDQVPPPLPIPAPAVATPPYQP
jgi:hypothetical protein